MRILPVHRARVFAGIAGVLLAASPALAAEPVEIPGTPAPAAAPAKPARPAKPPKPTIDELFAKLASAPDEASAKAVSGEIEKRWQESGSATIDVLMVQAARAMEASNAALALDLLDAVVRLKPDYAEGWNRRAAVLFQASDYGRAIGDIEHALALEPRHFVALSGLATVLRHLEQKAEALRAYEEVLKLNPRDADAIKARDELQREIGGRET
jgi:tetratricopeptide (TPR) repeat protein